jgi:hypothetical protein
MEGARAAERHEHEIAWVKALFRQHGVKRADHVVVGDPHDGERRLLHREAQRVRNGCDHFVGGLGV